MKTTLRRMVPTIAALLLMAEGNTLGNNIQVTKVTLAGQNTTQDHVRVTFDLAWENSWRVSGGPANWDAAWVFVKFRKSGGSWKHATLNYVNGVSDGHLKPAGSEIGTASGGVGAFVYRTADGSGNVNYPQVGLRWNYGVDGVGDTEIVDVQVLAVEVVYVPGGAFSLGTGILGTEAAPFYSPGPLFSTPYNVASENAITVGTAIGNLYYANLVNAGDRLGPIPAAYPKGFRAFYCMKYEVSQEQWIAFFNSLTTPQKAANDVTDAAHKNADTEVAGNAISWTSGSATTTRPDFPLSYVGWTDALAYLDWAGLRPITELEYEKACRGALPPVADEYAWGNSNVHGSVYTLLSAGSAFERISDPGSGVGNSCNSVTASGLGRPMRCGVFAASALNKTREETGGSYYGIMELSGNLYERVITAGLPAGRAFAGGHGNGVLTSAGEADVVGWPSGGQAVGGYRGGSYTNNSSVSRVSDRTDAANNLDIINSRVGFRGGRTAP